MSESKFEFPRQMERLCAALAKYYEINGNSLLHRLVVNARYEVDEEVYYDNWDGGQYSHGVTFRVPSEIFYGVFDNLESVENTLRDNLERLSRIPDEHVHWVRVQMLEDESIAHWREESGLLIRPGPLTVPQSDADLERIWDAKCVRLFMSHKVSYKVECSAVKASLLNFGISAFVAHEDIQPTKEWQDEIERALSSMHLMAAFLTSDFHDSDWTDQEVGFAIGRGVPVFAIRLGKDPYGFIGKYQGIPAIGRNSYDVATEIVRLALDHKQLAEVMVDALLYQFSNALNFDHAGLLVDLLDETLKKPDKAIAERLETAQRESSQVRGCFRCRRKLPSLLARLRS